MLENLLPRNEAMWDRGLRVVLGLVGLSLIFWGPKSMLGLFGLIPLVTGLVGSCPLYTLAGVGTCSTASAEQTKT
jgi:hypothetical protein